MDASPTHWGPRMNKTTLAILWHQHQPYYPDDLTGETLMPWVRLHAAKDYYGMALHLLEVPEFRCTINLVPSLVRQLLACSEGRVRDRHLEISRKPADGLTEEEALYLLDQFFMANPETMIRPFPRYMELYQQRRPQRDTARTALPRFSTRDLRDLQVWHNLVWIHPLAFERDAELAEFRRQAQDWTEEEKSWLLDKQLSIVREVLPLHRQLADSGQVELTTTPFYHPIMPLLWDKRLARQAMPGCALPRHVEGYPEDLHEHLRRAVALHTEQFGRPPVGLWPSEGSVCEEILPLIAEHGFRWLATDEEILACSLGGAVGRGERGDVRSPELLYQPWRCGEDGLLQIVFRDHALSDLIGFQYQRMNPQAAAADLLERVRAIGQAVVARRATPPALVSIILDGENCWEYYPDGGVTFLRTLYRRAVSSEHLRPMTISEHLEQFPATDRIERLFAGSWIAHNFAIWIGHEEDNTAWDLLHDTRQRLIHEQHRGGHDPEALQRAWNEIYIAEGSDWFWWYGDDHNSAQDELFDWLFRKHLQNVYHLLGLRVPGALLQPISRAAQRRRWTQPSAFLNVRLDGYVSFFEWLGAGHYAVVSERGTMTQVTGGRVKELFFGFDDEHLLLRLDTPINAAEDLADTEIHVIFLQPRERTVVFRPRDGSYHAQAVAPASGTSRHSAPPDERSSNHPGPTAATRLATATPPAPATTAATVTTSARTAAAIAVAAVAEIAIPLAELAGQPGEPLRFYLELHPAGGAPERVPQESVLETRIPDRHSQLIEWIV
ncbi:MAG: alpha-amylase/alpha-mannosidase [Planctomycetota bacterium]|nr:MAG: alpha-amylase/alpha-mannosidase [Planctomycetota bacterium]